MDPPIRVFESGIRTFMLQTDMDLFAININTKFAKYAAVGSDPRAA